MNWVWVLIFFAHIGAGTAGTSTPNFATETACKSAGNTLGASIAQDSMGASWWVCVRVIK